MAELVLSLATEGQSVIICRYLSYRHIPVKRESNTCYRHSRYIPLVHKMQLETMDTTYVNTFITAPAAIRVYTVHSYGRIVMLLW